MPVTIDPGAEWNRLAQDQLAPPPPAAPSLLPDFLANFIGGMGKSREAQYQLSHPDDIAEAHAIQKETAKHILNTHKWADTQQELETREKDLQTKAAMRQALEGIANKQNPYNPALDNQPVPPHNLVGTVPGGNGIPDQPVYTDTVYNAAKTANEAGLKNKFSEALASNAGAVAGGKGSDPIEPVDPGLAADVLQKTGMHLPKQLPKSQMQEILKNVIAQTTAAGHLAATQSLASQKQPITAMYTSRDPELRDKGGPELLAALPEPYKADMQNYLKYH